MVFTSKKQLYFNLCVSAILLDGGKLSDHEVKKRAKVVHFSRQGSRVRLPLIRSDGWMELKMGNFFNDTGEDGDVEARLMQIRQNWKHGLIVQGIEFRAE
ncbi:hypothetical protein H5410_022660 [Solanum commersonii]|uniref:Uncharacterized protein n=1 Tax=Solanum commersonii TaxID=4109 RepID=A0A9J5ZEP0_SOLCO|nr:hypothetical protein H5410_022660 [Solanum commersonii]